MPGVPPSMPVILEDRGPDANLRGCQPVVSQGCV